MSKRRFITSVRVDHKPGAPHEYVTVWIRGANCGTLCVGQGDGAVLEALLLGDRETLDRIAAAADRVMGIDVLSRYPDLVERHSLCSQCGHVHPPGEAHQQAPAVALIPPGPSTIRKHQGFIDDPVRTPVFDRDVKPADRIAPEQRAALKRINEGLNASARQDMERCKADLERAADWVNQPVLLTTTGPEQRAQQVLAESLAEAGQDVVLVTEGREFHVHPSVDLEAINRARAHSGMPLLQRIDDHLGVNHDFANGVAKRAVKP